MNETYTVEKTGGQGDSCLFNHAIFENKEHTKEVTGIDFVSSKERGEINFLHISSLDNEESIWEKGLIISTGDYTNDLGVGVYVVDVDDDIAIDNLKNYVESHFEDGEERFLVVTGTYEGDYLLCQTGYGHEGYIVIKESIPSDKINDIQKVSVDHFICEY